MLSDQRYFGSHERGYWFGAVEIVSRWRDDEQRLTNADASGYLWYSSRCVQRSILDDYTREF